MIYLDATNFVSLKEQESQPKFEYSSFSSCWNLELNSNRYAIEYENGRFISKYLPKGANHWVVIANNKDLYTAILSFHVSKNIKFEGEQE